MLALSLLVFLFWDGALWSAREGDSHAGRIFISYAVVIPLVAALLFATKRWSWVHLTTSTGLLWAVKLLLTSTLYFALAPTTTRNYRPRASWETATATGTTARDPATKYRAASSPGSHAKLSGSVTEHGAAIAGALVFIEQPPSGLPSAREGRVQLTVHDSRYDRAIYAAGVHDQLRVTNEDALLHTLRFTRLGTTRANLPLPPSNVSRMIAAPGQPGIYTLACENHSTEQAVFAVFDHPYFTLTGGDGRFTMESLPLGTMTLVVRTASGREHKQPITVAEGTLQLPAIDVSEDQG